MAQMKPNQLPSDRGDHLSLVLASRRQVPIPRKEPMLLFPSNLFNLFADHFLPLAQGAAHGGPVSVRPRSCHDDASQMGIPGLGDRATPDALAHWNLRSTPPRCSPSAPGPCKARNLPQFSLDCHFTASCTARSTLPAACSTSCK